MIYKAMDWRSFPKHSFRQVGKYLAMQCILLLALSAFCLLAYIINNEDLLIDISLPLLTSTFPAMLLVLVIFEIIVSLLIFIATVPLRAQPRPGAKSILVEIREQSDPSKRRHLIKGIVKLTLLMTFFLIISMLALIFFNTPLESPGPLADLWAVALLIAFIHALANLFGLARWVYDYLSWREAVLYLGGTVLLASGVHVVLVTYLVLSAIHMANMMTKILTPGEWLVFVIGIVTFIGILQSIGLWLIVRKQNIHSIRISTGIGAVITLGLCLYAPSSTWFASQAFQLTSPGGLNCVTLVWAEGSIPDIAAIQSEIAPHSSRPLRVLLFADDVYQVRPWNDSKGPIYFLPHDSIIGIDNCPYPAHLQQRTAPTSRRQYLTSTVRS